jgi:nicotinate-nucleotide adenylyltransferase
MRLGILGGTFDPPHLAHLIMGECAREQLSLDRVLWVVAADPPHKQGQVVASAEHRLRMVEMALADNMAFGLSRIDVDRSGPHYTVDMLSLLSTQYPGSDLFFLLGTDSLRDLPTWRSPVQLARQATLAVMERAGAAYDMTLLESSIPDLHSHVVTVTAPVIDISASDIRARVASGRTIHYLLPADVEAYIHTQGLYRST